MFIVKYSKGSWDDWHEVDVFVTESEEVAQKWVEKFNRVLEKWKVFFNVLKPDSISYEEEESYYEKNPILFKYYDITEINKASYEQIEKR